MRTKKIKNPAKLFDPSALPSEMSSVFVQTDTCQTCVRQPVGDSIGMSVGKSVGNPLVNVAKSRNFFATLCEIPMGYISSVYPLVKR
jgi:hypothetical protein